MTSNITKHKVFISYHDVDREYKDMFVSNMGDSIIDKSVQVDDIDDTNLPVETIRQRIRDKFIQDTTVTIVLIGPCTWQRKHVDWEIGTSLRDTRLNPRCGLLGILLPNHPNARATGVSLSSPPRGFSIGPPPQDSILGPPPQGFSIGPPPQDSILGLPPRGFSIGPPPRDSILGLPPREFSIGPPPRDISLNLVPPRVADNVGGHDPYATIYNWSNDANEIRNWIDHAYNRRDGNPPNNSRPQYKNNRSGNYSTDWQS